MTHWLFSEPESTKILKENLSKAIKAQKKSNCKSNYTKKISRIKSELTKLPMEPIKTILIYDSKVNYE